MSSRRILTQNIASLTLLQAVNYTAPLITLPFLVHVLQPSYFGLLSMVQGIVLYFDFFIDFGFNFSSTRSLANTRRSDEAVSRIFWSTLFAKTGLLCLSSLALAALVLVTPRLRPLSGLFAAGALSLLGTTLFPLWLFQGLERLKLAAASLGFARLLTVPAIVLLVKRPQDYVVAAAIQASVELVAFVAVAPFIVRHIRVGWYRPSLAELSDCYKQAWPLFLSGSSLFLTTYSTTVILGTVSSSAEVGYFSAADKLIKAAIAALNPLGQALYPHIVSARRISSSSALRIIRQSFFATSALSLLASCATFLFAEPVCRILLGSSFHQSARVLQCLAPLPLLYGLLNVLGTQAMLVYEMEKTLVKIMVFSALVGLPATMLLSYLFGAVGSAAGSVITAMLIVSGAFWSLRRKGLQVWSEESPEVATTV